MPIIHWRQSAKKKFYLKKPKSNYIPKNYTNLVYLYKEGYTNVVYLYKKITLS
jgi:hypothetical protein